MMRNRRLLFAMVLIGTMVFGTLVVATAQGVDDKTIVSEIQAKLFDDSVLKTRDIRVDSQNGVVTLAGSVNTQLEKGVAERIASEEKGVQKVISSLRVQEATTPAGGTVTNPAPQAPAKSRSVTIPSGTVVTVRMIDRIDSKVNQPGQEFAASLNAPVAAGDRVVFPQGSDARVRLVQAKESGHFKGSSELELELISLSANGSTYNVQSGYYEVHGASRGKRTAETVGGGAALGTIIGAIAGGRKGAAIGAGAGAAAGAGVQAVTRGPQVKVPSETKIDFTLKAPITVTLNPEKGLGE